MISRNQLHSIPVELNHVNQDAFVGVEGVEPPRVQ